jgi:hypothetical protein
MMKKMLLASALLCAALGAVFAQEGASGGTRFSTGYVLNKFPETSVEDGWLRGARGIVQEANLSNDERRIWGGLGNSRDIDTASELLAMASVLGIQDVKKEDALKLYAEIAMEGAANSFLGATGAWVAARGFPCARSVQNARPAHGLLRVGKGGINILP